MISTTDDEVIRDMIRLAFLLNVAVTATINERPISVGPESDFETVYTNYQRMRKNQ